MMFGGGMLLGWLLPLILLVLAGMWLFNNAAGNRTETLPGASQKTPEEILKERYARGEISREEFESTRQALRQ